jgi:threonine aldolase
VQTNIVIFSVKPSGLSSAEFLSRLSTRGVLAVPVDAERVRMVTHLDVTRREVEAAADAVHQALNGKMPNQALHRN